MKLCSAICTSRGLIWQRVCYLKLSYLLFGTNCVVVIIEYWSSNRFHYEWIGRQNKKLEMKCISESLRREFFWKECAAGQIFNEIKCAAGKTCQTKCAAGRIFWLSLCILCPVNAVRNFPRISAQNLLLLMNGWINQFIN